MPLFVPTVKTSVRRVYAAIAVAWLVFTATTTADAFLYARPFWTGWYLAAAASAAWGAGFPRRSWSLLAATVLSVVGFASRAAMIVVAYFTGRGDLTVTRMVNGASVWLILAVIMWGYGHASVFAAISPPGTPPPSR